MEIYRFSEPGTWSLVPGVLALAVTMLLVLIAMSTLRGRLYCNTVCPVGAFLGLLSRSALFRIRLDSDACTNCGMCARQCRADCIHLSPESGLDIDRSSCVGCFDCLSVCPTGSLTFGRRLGEADGVVLPASADMEALGSAPSPSGLLRGARAEDDPRQPSPFRRATNSRRDFLGLATASVAGVAAIPLRRVVIPRLLPSNANPITPPGSLGIEHFASRCTGCHLCVAACPTGVIRPEVRKYGLRGLTQPTLSYVHGYCAFDCNICSQVCPTGAIQALPLKQKQRTKIGAVELYKNRCIVFERYEECGACAEVCPTHAIYTVARDGLLCPETDQDSCVGCGTCEHVCPTRPRAIVVKGTSPHGKAKAPFTDRLLVPTLDKGNQSDTPEEEGFPF